MDWGLHRLLSFLIRENYILLYENNNIFYKGVIVMRFREVERNIEKEVIKKKEEDENFKKIKPEINTTVKEVNDFWNNVFASSRES